MTSHEVGRESDIGAINEKFGEKNIERVYDSCSAIYIFTVVPYHDATEDIFGIIFDGKTIKYIF